MPPKSVMVAKSYRVVIADLREYPVDLTEAQLAEFLGISEAQTRRRRTGKEYAGQPWPEHHRSAVGRGQVLYSRVTVKAFLEGCPGVEA